MLLNKLGRFVACTAAAAVALASGTVVLTAAAENTADNRIRIEGETGCIYDEEYMFCSSVENEILSGEQYGNIRTQAETVFDSEQAVFSYSFEVETDGQYSLEFTASKYNNTNYSSYAVAVDDGEFISVINGDTATKTADIGSDNVFAAYKMNSGYLLTAGFHTLSFKMLDTGTRTDGRGYVFLDYAEFTQTGSIPGLTINGADEKTISNSVVSEYSESQGTADYPVFKTQNGVACPEDGVVISYRFSVPEDGLYNLTISASQYNGSLSTYAVAVNDGDFTKIDSSSVTGAAQIEGVIYEYSTGINYALTAGINTISFKILTGRTSDSRVYCFLNYMQLSKVNVEDYAVVYGTDAHTTNAGIIGSDVYAESTSEIPGALVIKTISGAAFPETEGVIVGYNMYVPADGIYRMSLSANKHTSDNMSGYAVSVNGGEYQSVNSANAGPSDTPNGGRSATNEDNLMIYNTTGLYRLAKGMNTVSFKLTGPRASDGRGYAALEYIRFTPEAAFTESVKVYGTDTHGLSFTPSSAIGESVGERFAQNVFELYASQEEFEKLEEGPAAAYTVNAAAAGKYKLTIAASEYSGKQWLSPYSISVNGGEYIPINEENAGNAASPNGGWEENYPNVNADASQQLVIGIYETDLVFDLNEGINTISFRLDALTDNGSKAIAALAWLRLDEYNPEEESETPDKKVIFDNAVFSSSGAEWTVHNNTDSAITVTVIMAAYNEGVLSGCELKELTVASGESGEANFLSTEEHIKLFAWDSMNALKPLANGQSK